MKIKYSSIVGILAALVLIASFVVPANLARTSPASAASSQSIMQWWPVDTMDTTAGQVDSLYTPKFGTWDGGSEIVKLLVGVDGQTMFAIISEQVSSLSNTSNSMVKFRKSTNGGRTWSGSTYGNLANSWSAEYDAYKDKLVVWDMAIAPDNKDIVVAVVSILVNAVVPSAEWYRQFVWITTDGGGNWQNTQWPPTGAGSPMVTAGNANYSYISCVDISMDFGARELLVGVRNGTGAQANNLWVMKMPGYSGWNVQNGNGTPASTAPFVGDIIDAHFSPTYNGDSTIIVLYTSAALPSPVRPAGTFLATGVHDLAKVSTSWQLTQAHVELKNSGTTAGSSPTVAEIITGMIQLPSDFSGQSASLRRVYVSTDAVERANPATGYPNRGVYRIDDNVIYTLMDNSTTFALEGNTSNRRAHSIAYWGTYASGKLLVGETLGQTCTATVPVWFTDSPTVCPVPCWYPAKKPPTGAAGYTDCRPGDTHYGNAFVVWSPTFAAQGVAYAVTGAMSYDGPWGLVTSHGAASTFWPAAIFNINNLDESAFSLTRNNGETWNQLSLIDTHINKLTDVAPSADCTTVYLASVNNGVACEGFDSVWRSSMNEKVVAPPLPALPIGSYWERVRTSVTALSCNAVTQSNYAILRLAPDKLDGQIIGWAAGGTSGLNYIGNFLVGANTRAMAWSPDFGDYWADINPRISVQDFAWESSTILYVLDLAGLVQKLPYTGTAWASTLNTLDNGLSGGHVIYAMAPDKVISGADLDNSSGSAAAVSSNGGTSFTKIAAIPVTRASVGYDAIFDTDFVKNATIYVASDGGYAGFAGGPVPAGTNRNDTYIPHTGLVFRNTWPAGAGLPWTNMMTGMCYIGYTGPHEGYYGIVQSNSKNVTGQGTLYAAHTIQGSTTDAWLDYSGVERTLSPLDGIPKPGLEWTCMDAASTMFRAMHPVFTLEPTSLKICGCLTQDTNSTLYAIDNDFYSDNHNQKLALKDRWNNAFGVKTTGLLWEYTDCMAKKGPKLTLDDGAIIGCDPATGRNQEVNFRWEQLCIAIDYQLQIAKDKAFTLQVFNSGPVCGSPAWGIRPVDVTSPAFVYFSAGKGAMPAEATRLGSNDTSSVLTAVAAPNTQWLTEYKYSTLAELECGHAYFWRVRVLDEATYDIVNSPWSEVRGFTIKAGFRVTTPYYGPQLLAPDNGCGCACNAPIAFSWSPFKETVEYSFVLSENADMSSPLVTTAVKTTAYQFTGTVKCNKTYFWRVMATKPAPSEWSAVFSFVTQPEPAKPVPPPPAPETPLWVWVIIAIGAILVIVTLVLIFKTRRV